MQAPDTAEPPRTVDLTRSQVGELLADSNSFPLGNARITGKASLAGVQEKTLLARRESQAGPVWAQCLFGYPSTHILKPVSLTYPDMIYNEEFALRIARTIGIVSYASWIETFDGRDALVIERYDRDERLPDGRLHQEDFCQVLGVSSAQKYQEQGGAVSLRRIARALVTAQDHSGLSDLLRMLTYAIAIGNLDMHAKNISIVHPMSGQPRLAPAYDLVPLTHYANSDGRMAMSINDTYEHSRLTLDDVLAEARSWGMAVSQANEIVESTAEQIDSALLTEQPHGLAAPDLPEKFAANVRQYLR